MLNLLKMVDDAVLAARQLELLLYGDVLHMIPVYLFTDPESTLESVASTKQIATQTLRNVIVDLKQRLVNGEVTSYAWLPTTAIWADILTKEKKRPPHLEDVLDKNICEVDHCCTSLAAAFLLVGTGQGFTFDAGKKTSCGLSMVPNKVLPRKLEILPTN